MPQMKNLKSWLCEGLHWLEFSSLGLELVVRKTFVGGTYLQRENFNQTMFKSNPEASNGQTIVKIAPIWTIFGRFRSRRHDLSFWKFSRRSKKFRDEKTSFRVFPPTLGPFFENSAMKKHRFEFSLRRSGRFLIRFLIRILLLSPIVYESELFGNFKFRPVIV